MYDLVIIGAGPAGITAAVYAARKRMNFLVIAQDIGGQTAWSGDIENYTGYQFITGPELTGKFEEHMRKYNVELKEEQVLGLTRRKETPFVKTNIVKTNKGTYESKTVIIASGARSRELGVPGEKKFKNKGRTYCATCDGPLFSGKDVAVVGGGNSGLEAVLQLIKIARHIYLIDIAPDLSGDPIVLEKIKAGENVTILTNTQVISVLGDKMVNAIKVKTEDKEKILAVEGIFVEIGLIPNSEFAGELEKNKRGEIKVDIHNETNIHSAFAAGDVTNVPEKQIIIAAGEGAKAALEAFRYLSRIK